MPGARLALGSLGGTITMTTARGGSGVAPTMSADDLLAGMPDAAGVADVDTATLATVPGASLGFADVLGALEWAERKVADGCAGVVLVQGTDTLEETSYLLDLHWDRPEPLVVTGAMRPPSSPGADGPA
ncbi:MAG: asparaginase domain-containing protein, partial [Nocardioides sp.]